MCATLRRCREGKELLYSLCNYFCAGLSFSELTTACIGVEPLAFDFNTEFMRELRFPQISSARFFRVGRCIKRFGVPHLARRRDTRGECARLGEIRD
jgi:hypothetical protein